jgi:cell division protein FtsI/penicillin-binding protein 2
MMNPQTGAIVAMCSLPDFDPNNYSKVKSLEQFNNTAIFTAYEPGSVFKPFTMSAALDLGLVNPQTTFAADPCKFDVGKGLQPIRNAENKCYPGTLTMTNILEHSINTDMTWVVGKIGLEKFREYVQKYGFGEKTGIPLSTEVAGTMAGLNLKINMYYSSFGQGLATTPLQLAVAYSAMANDGAMPKPYIIDEIHHPNGTIEKTQPKILEQVISTPAAKRITGMLVSVVENTYTKSVRIPEYYIAAKTGTAQVPQKGGYKSSAYNHTLAGYGPATNAKVVLIVKYEEPDRRYAESTAAPIFKDVMKFALDYYNVPSER